MFAEAKRQFAQVLGYDLERDDISRELGDVMDSFALGIAFNVHPKVFKHDVLLRFCQSRIKHDNIKPILVMIQRTWTESQSNQQPTPPPKFDTGLAFTRYEVHRMCQKMDPKFDMKVLADVFAGARSAGGLLERIQQFKPIPFTLVVPDAEPAEATSRAATVDQPPGAAPRSMTVCPVRRKRCSCVREERQTREGRRAQGRESMGRASSARGGASGLRARRRRTRTFWIWSSLKAARER
jgi:hypothetical protein